MKGTKVPGVQDNQETGGKGDTLLGKREMEDILPGGTTAGRNAMQKESDAEGIRRKSFSEVMLEGVRR